MFSVSKKEPVVWNELVLFQHYTQFILINYSAIFYYYFIFHNIFQSFAYFNQVMKQ